MSARMLLGGQSVREAIRADPKRVARVLVQADGGPRSDALARFAADQGIAVERTTRSQLDRLSAGGRHQGVLAFAAPLSILELEQIELGERALLVLLDGITDPQNFGAVIRSAVAFEADAVVWGAHGSAPLTPATFRASAGAVEHATLCQVRSLRAGVEHLVARGVAAVALDAGSDTLLDALDLRGPVALVVGAEDRGVGKAVRRACTARARLPIGRAIDSLNASVAAAVALYEVQRQRRFSP